MVGRSLGIKVVIILVAKHGQDQQDVKVTEGRALYECSDRERNVCVHMCLYLSVRIIQKNVAQRIHRIFIVIPSHYIFQLFT